MFVACKSTIGQCQASPAFDKDLITSVYEDLGDIRVLKKIFQRSEANRFVQNLLCEALPFFSRGNLGHLVDDVYDDLDTFKGDRANEYLKRLFSIVSGWRNLFEYACTNIGQNNKYGIQNIKSVRSEYPGIPAVFYTRKSMINDAVTIFRAGADGLFIKPTGKNNEETRKVTREYAPELIMSLKKLINN